ncbi:MAG: discoidin domain-containing protein [Planctomycetaceae bacterium]|nr:discoidin domain-containing protein [Planctomycetaceae bacterium]
MSTVRICFFAYFTLFFGWVFAEDRIVHVHVSVNSENANYEGILAMDGSTSTMWHTQFGTAVTHPHEFLIDLRDEYEIKAFSYVPRLDGAANGTVKDYEIYLGNDPKTFGEPYMKGAFEQRTGSQTLQFPTPQNCRYVKFVVLSEINGRGWASASEIVLHCDGVIFRAKSQDPLDLLQEALGEKIDFSDELVQQYAFLLENLKNMAHFSRVADETFLKDSLILPEDRDPLDVVLRRTRAALADLKQLDGAPDFAAEEKEWTVFYDQASKIDVDEIEIRYDLYRKLCELRRRILFKNPLLNFDEILFVKKHRATFNHMCDQYYGINLPPGGGVYVLSEAFGQAKSRNLLENSRVVNGRLAGTLLDTGAFATPDLSFDGQKIAFAYVECTGDTEQRFHVDPTRGHWHEGRSFHVFTCNADGSGLTQLTDGTWNDFDPCFLPNGRIAFISERRGGYLRCGRECPTFTLFDMNLHGGQMRCLSYHETNEWNPSVTADGRILYTRWDYVDRWGSVAHHPWLTTLDGRDAREVHGNFTQRYARADMELDCREIPNSHRFVATAAPHHGQAYGSLVIVDPQLDDTDDPMKPVKRLTPEIPFPESQGGAQVYGAAWPLSEKYYLAVADFSVHNGQGLQGGEQFRGDYGIYLIDAFGNKELLYRDPEVGCMSPIPFHVRPTPHSPPQSLENDEIRHQPYVAPNRGVTREAIASVVDVYQSRKPFPEGTKIKELRIIQVIPMSGPSGAPHHDTGFREPSAAASMPLCRYVLGTIPVEEDGSAHFVVPAQKVLLFQAIDEQGLAIQSMRSATYLKEGETLVCNGCHEPKNQTPHTTNMPIAFTRPPSVIKPEHPDANPFSYPRLVQPVLDKHCVDCHAAEIAKGTPDVPNLAKDPMVNQWYASYNELVPKYGFYDYKETLTTTPGKFGAHAAPLYKLLKDGHCDVKLSDEELHRISLWLDCVSPFYGVYEKEGGEAQLRGEIAFPTIE